MKFEWKKEKHDGMIVCGINCTEWGLPFSIRPYFGKYDKTLKTSSDGNIEFAKKESMGWCGEITISFFCFYLYIELSWWHI